MKLILSGVHADTDADQLNKRLGHFGPVIDIAALRSGGTDSP